MVYHQIVGIPIGANCAPLIADLFYIITRWILCLTFTFWGHQNFRIKIYWNYNFVGYYTIPFGFSLFWHFQVDIFNFWNLFVWRRISGEGSLSEMRIWSIFLVNSDLKWCIHLSRSLFLNISKQHDLIYILNYLDYICLPSVTLNLRNISPIYIQQWLRSAELLKPIGTSDE